MVLDPFNLSSKTIAWPVLSPTAIHRLKSWKRNILVNSLAHYKLKSIEPIEHFRWRFSIIGSNRWIKLNASYKPDIMIPMINPIWSVDAFQTDRYKLTVTVSTVNVSMVAIKIPPWNQTPHWVSTDSNSDLKSLFGKFSKILPRIYIESPRGPFRSLNSQLMS